MKLLVDIPEDVNKELKIYKVRNDLKTLSDGVNKILAEKLTRKDK